MAISQFIERFKTPSVIEPAGKAFARYKEITSDRVTARLMTLTGIEPSSFEKIAKHGKIWVSSKLHYNSAIDYRYSDRNPIMQETEKLAGLVLRFNKRKERINYSTELMYGGVFIEPEKRVSPYEQVYDIPLGRVPPPVSENKWSTLIAVLGGYTVAIAILALAEPIVGLFKLFVNANPQEKALGITGLMGIAVFCTRGVPDIRNRILMSTWKLHARQTYEAIEKYGIDGFIAIAMEPWRVFTIMRRMAKLEANGLINSNGFTDAGAEWYGQQMKQTIESLKNTS